MNGGVSAGIPHNIRKMKNDYITDSERANRMKTFRDTEKAYTDGYYMVGGKKINIPKVKASAFIPKGIRLDAGTYDTEIVVLPNDSFEAAQTLVNEGLNPLVLNMASPVRPGGGVRSGGCAQEESLCMRSNLLESLESFSHKEVNEYGYARNIYDKPIFGNSVILTRGVTVFRDTDANGYCFLSEPFTVDVVSAACISHPRLTPDGMMHKDDIRKIKDKFRLVLASAFFGNPDVFGRHNDSIVLGAWGCGVFSCPPDKMAGIMHDVLNEKGFKGAFKKVVFAIINNPWGKDTEKSNFSVFSKEFQQTRK